MRLRLAIALYTVAMLTGCWSSYWGRKHWWTSDGLTDSQRKAWQEYDRTNRPVLVHTNQTPDQP